MKHTINQIAATLDEAALTAKATQQVSSSQEISLAESYEIQSHSIARRLERGESITGFKLGFTSKEKMVQMGVHDIIWGRLTDSMHIEQNGTLIRDQFIHPRTEPEIAFKIKKRIDKIISIEDIADYIEAVAGALEIIDSRYENFKFSLEDVIADNCSSSGYVLGEWLPPSTSVQDLSISLIINDKEVQSGNSNAILGNPLESLVEISKMMVQYNEVLEAGSIILAGAATAAVHIHKEDKIEAHFKNLGIVKFNVS